ncbi:MAG: HAD family hydrolase [Anaerolineae bacterium]|nr:HAD family hydrolase [Anaerolineae bacterium]
MLRAVLFDMDDTLVDWSTREDRWEDLTRQHLAPIHDHLRIAGHTVPDLTTMVEAYSEQNRRAWETITPPEWNCPRQIDILQSMLKMLGLETEKVDMDNIQRLFAWGPVPGVRPFDGTIEVLCTLRETGLKTGLITNASMPMWMRDAELKAMGLLEYLDVRLTAGDVGKFKPHTKPFHEALQRLHIAADEAVFVGDQMHDDVAGAQAAGMRAVWIRRGADVSNGSCKPNATIVSIRELLNTLDLWFPGWR